MKSEVLGRIMSRSLGVFLILIGLVSLFDHLTFLWVVQDAMHETGWSNYPPVEGTDSGDLETDGDNPSTTFLHDSYAVVSGGLFSPVGSGLLILIGLIFTFLSKPIGRFLAGGKSE